MKLGGRERSVPWLEARTLRGPVIVRITSRHWVGARVIRFNGYERVWTFFEFKQRVVCAGWKSIEAAKGTHQSIESAKQPGDFLVVNEASRYVWPVAETAGG